MMIIHEFGHAFAIRYTTSVSSRIVIWPGYELYPELGAKYPRPWPGKSFAITEPVFLPKGLVMPNISIPPAPIPRLDPEIFEENENVIMLWGSVATLSFSILSLTLISILKPGKVLLYILVAGSLMHLDILAYAVFSGIFGLPHFVFWGGAISEPIVSLESMGIPKVLAIASIIGLSWTQFFWLHRLLRANKSGVAT